MSLIEKFALRFFPENLRKIERFYQNIKKYQNCLDLSIMTNQPQLNDSQRYPPQKCTNECALVKLRKMET